MSESSPNDHPASSMGYQKGRISLRLSIIRTGPDLLITVLGGDSHIGAVAVGSKGDVHMYQCQGHREGEIAQHMAKTLAEAGNCTVCVVCGIHFEKISREEIAQVLEGCAYLERAAAEVIAQKNTEKGPTNSPCNGK